MNNNTKEVLGLVDAYLRESVHLPLEEKPSAEDIEFHIKHLLVDNNQTHDIFSIKIINLDNSYIIIPLNFYSTLVVGEMPMFCKVCGKLLEFVNFRSKKEIIPGYLPCSHESEERII